MIEAGAILIPLGLIGICTLGILVGGNLLIDKYIYADDCKVQRVCDKIHNKFFKEKI